MSSRRPRRAAAAPRPRARPGWTIAAGEYGYDLAYFRRMLEAGAVDVLQADATRCAGSPACSRCALRCLRPAALGALRAVAARARVTMQEPGVSKIVSVNLNRNDSADNRRAVA